MNNFHYGYWLPPDISASGGPQIDQLINWIHVFMGLLFAGWGIFLIYCLIRFRARPGHEADTRKIKFGLPKYIELLVVAVEAVLLIFFSYPIWAHAKRDFPAPSDSLTIRVTGEQFAWDVQYSGPDGKFGRRRSDLIDGTNPIGLDHADPNAKDDLIEMNEINIPVNKPVIVYLTTKDVIHSFSIPVLRVKQDAIPGSEIPLWFEANQTGQFDIACAQLCGLGHYRMRGTLNVMTQEEWDRWRDSEEKTQNSPGANSP